MIECVKIERAAATWNIYGNIISEIPIQYQRHNKEV